MGGRLPRHAGEGDVEGERGAQHVGASAKQVPGRRCWGMCQGGACARAGRTTQDGRARASSTNGLRAPSPVGAAPPLAGLPG